MTLAICESADDVRQLARRQAEWRRQQFIERPPVVRPKPAVVVEAPAPVVKRVIVPLPTLALCPPTTAVRIIQIVCVRFNLPGYLLLSDRRTASIVRPRQIAMWLVHKHTALSLPQIGRKFGGRDHTTVLHAVRKIEHLRSEDAALAATIAELEAEILA